ncbi:Com family DNA-binding transcriptional regulator [Burkholderia ambifaria]|uniref:Com family DNA-binding transcriptional regulator n=2 Tax=Burkholderiaceae TaxID=119060 RepID=UPI00312C864B
MHAPHPQSRPAGLARAATPLERRRHPSTGRNHPMQDIRCGSCNRKLGAGEYVRLTIKCPRCGAMNILRAASPLPAGHRASDTRESPHAANHLR